MKTKLIITKANDLIRKSRYNLTIKEQQILINIIQKISMDDDDFYEYEFSISDFCNLIGVNLSGRS